MNNSDTLVVIIIAVFIITGWLPTYIIMQRKLVAERTYYKDLLATAGSDAFELGVIAGRDEERRDMLTEKLARRRANFPNNR